MSENISIGAIFQVRLLHRISGQLCLNVFAYELSNGPITWPDDGLAFANSFRTQVQEPMYTLLSEQVSCEGIALQPILPVRYRSVIQGATVTEGAINAAPVPSGAAVVVRRQGLVAGRRNQGRVYIPGVPSENVIESRLDNLTAAAWRLVMEPALAASLVAPPLAAELIPVIYNPAAPADPRDVASVVVDPIIRYQRRREVGVGQ